MEKFRLGKTDLMVTKIAFGGIPIQRLTEEGAIEVVRKCIDLGINFIDTANGYSNSEERIGKAIKGYNREDLIIATKTGGRDAKTAQEHLDLSLKRLQTDYIDIYQFHGVSTPAHMKAVLEEGIYDVAVKAQKEGKIKHISVTSHSMEMSKELVKTDMFETLMFPFNFITNEPLEELIPLCRKHDVGFIAMKPMAGGMLENAAVAFKWMFQYPDILPLIGIEKIEEIEEIVALAEGDQKMTDAEAAQMQALIDELGQRFCRRCDYCQPCPQEIPISMVMTSRSFYKRMPPERFFGGMVEPAIEKAVNCIECGECETRCPYNLPIREMLAEHVKWFYNEKEQYETSKA